MARIVIDARIISSSTGRYCLRLLQNLEKIDYDNEYIVLVPSKDLDYWRPTARNFRLQAADFANYSLAEQIGFKKLLDELDADLVHFCMPQQPIMYRRLRVTTVHDLTLLNTYNSDKNWLTYHTKQLAGRFIFKKIGRDSALIICPSEYTKREYASYAGVNPDKITVTYEAADPADKVYEKYDLPFKKYLLYVGTQSDYKNLIRLSDAHQKLLAKYPDLGLVFVGRINESPTGVAAHVKKMGYENVHFTGFIPDKQRNWLFKNCESYIFPSLMEGFGLPGLEAIANSAPVVSSNATCLPEIYGDAVEYFDPLDVGDMAAAIDRVLSDDKLRTQLIKRGQKQLKKYSWVNCAEQTHGVYVKALGLG